MASVTEISQGSTRNRLNSDDYEIDSDFEVIGSAHRTSRRKEIIDLEDDDIKEIPSLYTSNEYASSVVEGDDTETDLDTGIPRDENEEDEVEEDVDEDDEPVCPICLDNLPNQEDDLKRTTRSKQMLARTTCQHYYHYFCIKSWSEKANTCPQCRSTFKKIETLSLGKVIETESVEDKKFPVEVDQFDFLDYDYNYDAYVDVQTFPICCLCDEVSTSASGHAVCADCGGAFHLGCLGIMGSGASYWNCPMCDSRQTHDTITAAVTTTRRSRAARTARTLTNSANSIARAARRSNGGSLYVQSLREEIRNNRYTELGIDPVPVRNRNISRRVNRNSTRSTNAAQNVQEPDYAAIVDANRRYEAAQLRERQSREHLTEENKAWKVLDHVQNGSPSRSNRLSSSPAPVTESSSSSTSVRKFKRPKRSMHKHDRIQDNIDTNPHVQSNLQSQLSNNQKTVVANLIIDMKNNTNNYHGNNSISSSNSNFPEGSCDLHLIKQPLPPPSFPPPGFTSLNDGDDATNDSNDENLKQQVPTRLTVEALEKHDSTEIMNSGSLSNVQAKQNSKSTMTQQTHQNKNQDSLNYVQKSFIQKLLISNTLKRYKYKYKLSSGMYTTINKSVSRQVYKLVLRDVILIQWMNKIIELLERYETSHSEIGDFLNNLNNDVDDISKRDEFKKLYSVRIEAMIDLELSNSGII